MWNEEFSNTMLTLGFKQLKTDYCCFTQHDEEEFTILIEWVDDILAISLNNAGNDIIKQELKGKFEVNSIGKPTLLLGMKLKQKDHLIIISQTHYINSLLQKFKLENANPVSTPLDPNVNLDENNNSKGIEEEGSKTQGDHIIMQHSLVP